MKTTSILRTSISMCALAMSGVASANAATEPLPDIAFDLSGVLADPDVETAGDAPARSIAPTPASDDDNSAIALAIPSPGRVEPRLDYAPLLDAAPVVAPALASARLAREGDVVVQAPSIAAPSLPGADGSIVQLGVSKGIDPLYGNIDPFYGTIDPFYGDIVAFWGNINPFYGTIQPFYGNIDPFYGDISPFYGNIQPFWGDIVAFWGDIKPFYGDIVAFDTGLVTLGSFWKNNTALWQDLDKSWALTSTTGQGSATRRCGARSN